MLTLRHILTTGCLLLAACSATPYVKPADPTEAGRDFIRATLDADFHIADKYPLHDSLNTRLYDRYKDWFKNLSSGERKAYKDATITINKVEKINDTTTVIDFSNTYKKQPMEIRLIKTASEWWVDFQYTFADRMPMDSTNVKMDSTATKTDSAAVK